VQGRIQKVELLVDRTSIEVFVNNGEVSSTRYVLPRGNGLSVKAEGGPANIKSLTLHRLDSAWATAVDE
jgi:levanase/fructan beta-fructosidase